MARVHDAGFSILRRAWLRLGVTVLTSIAVFPRNENRASLLLGHQEQRTKSRSKGSPHMADQVALRRIGFALSGIVALVALVAAMTVSANMGVL
jgi:hypothetical protein